MIERIIIFTLTVLSTLSYADAVPGVSNSLKSRLIASSGTDENRNRRYYRIAPKNFAGLTRKIDARVVGLASAENVEIASEYGMTIPAAVFNLAKMILGAGVLSLPAGVAMGLSDTPGALIPGSILLAAMGGLSAYSFASIGRACKRTKTTTLPDAWRESVSSSTSKVIAVVLFLNTFLACLAYSIIIGDTFTQISKAMGLPPLLTDRSNVIMGLSVLCIFPLCCLQKLEALKYTSIVGMLGVLYCAGFMALRFWDGSYKPGGQFYNSIAQNFKPSFGLSTSRPWYMAFGLLSMLTTAFVAHFNAPMFLAELQRPTLPRFNLVTGLGFGASVAVYMLVMWIGFLTFGGNSTGFVLNNYANSDVLATAARAAIGVGILTGYPLTFVALRDGLFDLLQFSSVPGQRQRLVVPVTAAVVALLTALALKLTDLGAVVSFSGALIGAAVAFLVPSMLNIAGLVKQDESDATLGKRFTVAQYLELGGNVMMAVMAVLISVIGVSISVLGLK